MKNKTAFLILLGLLLLGIVLYQRQDQKNSDVIHYGIDGMMRRLLVADNPQSWGKGLMDRQELDNAEGMIFVFPDKKIRTFWNQNTYLDLDIYWLDGDRVVGTSFLPSIEKSKKVVRVTSPEPVDKVIELAR